MGQFVANAATAVVPLASLTAYRMYKNATRKGARRKA